jgi:hypothetical protein
MKKDTKLYDEIVGSSKKGGTATTQGVDAFDIIDF